MSTSDNGYFSALVTGEAVPGRISYVRENPPIVQVKPFSGQTYTDLIPDTYDVASRAALGINALVGSTNPLADHELYWKVDFARNPIVMNHDWNDWCQVKFMEALPLLRLVSGSRQEEQVDRVWQEVTLKSLGPDGLYYIPMQGRPWAWNSRCWAKGVARSDGSLVQIDDPSTPVNTRQITHPFINGRMMGTLLVYWLRDQNTIWLEAVQKMVDRMAELAIYKDNYAYYPALVYEPNAVYDKDGLESEMPVHIMGGEINGRLPESLGKVYRLTGYEPARVLGEKLVRYVKNHMDYYGPGGEFLAEKHFHAHTIYLLSLLEFATAVGDRETVEFVRRGYEWAKTTAAGSADLVGFFPEVADPDWPSAESCEIADMIALALHLSAAGAGDYYGDAERWARNHFAEAQLTSAEWVNDQACRHPVKPVAPNETANRTAERNVGAFAQGSGGNEFWVKGPDGIVHCCTGNAARTLYYLWHDIIWFDQGVLRINMLLNRASPWGDVYSYIPYQGRIDIRIKTACTEVQVHLRPAWVNESDPGIFIQVDGEVRAARWDGRYLALGPVLQGQTIRIEFPIAERVEHAVMGKQTYELTVRGDTIVDINPPGTTGALYRRAEFRRGEPRWREVVRFLSEDLLDY
jgi:hypothetical protein